MKVSFVIKLLVVFTIYKFFLALFFPRIILTGISLGMVLFLFFFLLKNKLPAQIITGKVNVTNALIYFLLFLLGLQFVYRSFINPSDGVIQKFIILNSVQLAFPLITTYVFLNLNYNISKKAADFLYKITIPVIVFGFIEFWLPGSIRGVIIMYANIAINDDASIPTSYWIGDGGIYLNFLRLGSFFFEPITFGFISGIFLLYTFYKYQFQHKLVKAGVLFLTILSFGKLSIFTTLISLFANFFKRYAVLFFLLITFLVGIVFIISFQKIVSNAPSLGMHYLGLMSGLINGLEAPLLGHGIGSAGFLVAVECKKLGITGPFMDVTLTGLAKNGNESTIGVMVYQLGFVYTFLFVLLFFYLFIQLVKRRIFIFAGAWLGYLISLFFSESVLSLVIVTALLIFTTFPLKNSPGEYSANLKQ